MRTKFALSWVEYKTTSQTNGSWAQRSAEMREVNVNNAKVSFIERSALFPTDGETSDFRRRMIVHDRRASSFASWGTCSVDMLTNVRLALRTLRWLARIAKWNFESC
ncbi:MAG: hypothetical protein ACTS47_00895 [Candidatus Hodgkinia cicadicola]